MIDYQKDVINQLIQRLEQIRDTDEIKEISIIPLHIVEEFKMIDGTFYGTGRQTIEIIYNKLFLKKDEFDEWKELK